MRCESHIHVGGPEGGEVLVVCDLEVHPDPVPHAGWMRVLWTKEHGHEPAREDTIERTRRASDDDRPPFTGHLTPRDS